jgi:hypothetical protein
VDVALTGNFAYFTEREFATVLEAASTPFIALHKENVRPPRRVHDYWHAIYKQRRGKFTGRKILVYNDVERDLEISSGIVDPDKVIVTGAPRLDRIHRWRREHAGQKNGMTRPQVLFFGFSRQDKLTAIQRKPAAGVTGNMEAMEGDWGKLSWNGLGESTHHAMIDLACKHPDIQVIVKTKGQRRKQGDILSMLAAGGGEFPPNLRVITGGDPFELIANACVVVGFNTTGLLEAIAAGKPVIVPWFAEASESAMRDHIIDLGNAVDYAGSPEEMIEIICRYIGEPSKIPRVLTSEAAQVLKYWVGNEDGAAGQRVLNAVRAEIEGNTLWTGSEKLSA